VKPLRILLVDDEPETGAALEAWLKRQGYESTFANGPETADRAFATQEFDVVLSDIQMPGNFKLEWIARRLEAACPPPILLMTGSPELETAMRAANLPVAGYLLKPLFFEEAAATIERLGTDYRHRRELLDLSHEVTRLLNSHAPHSVSDPFTEELHRLAQQLATDAQRNPRESKATDPDGRWREAVAETIVVLERTKHSFRSKELGELRRRLLRLVPEDAVRKHRAPTVLAPT
jgi:DNA-binding NtrC family response regulator